MLIRPAAFPKRLVAVGASRLTSCGSDTRVHKGRGRFFKHRAPTVPFMVRRWKESQSSWRWIDYWLNRHYTRTKLAHCCSPQGPGRCATARWDDRDSMESADNLGASSLICGRDDVDLLKTNKQAKSRYIFSAQCSCCAFCLCEAHAPRICWRQTSTHDVQIYLWPQDVTIGTAHLTV